MQQPHSAAAYQELVPAWRRAAALGYMFALVDAFLLVFAIASAFVEVWQQAAAARRCHTAFWAKATPRVDVGDTRKTMVPASMRCGLWLGNLDKVGKGKEEDQMKDEEKEEVFSGSHCLLLLPGVPSYALWSHGGFDCCGQLDFRPSPTH